MNAIQKTFKFYKIGFSCMLIIWGALFSACQTTEAGIAQTETRAEIQLSPSPVPPTETKTVSSPHVTLPPKTTVEPTQTMPVPTPSPTMTRTAVPVPTTSRLEKVDIIPVGSIGLAVSNDGSLLASGVSETGTLYVYDLVNQTVKWEFDEDNRSMNQYTALSFSEDGLLLAGGGVQQDIFIWDMDNGQLIHKLPVPDSELYSEINALSFSSNNQYLTGLPTRTRPGNMWAMVWDLNTEQQVASLTLVDDAKTESLDSEYRLPDDQTTWSVGDVAFAPGFDNVLAVAISQAPDAKEDSFWAVYFWDIDNQTLWGGIPGKKGQSPTFSPNGQLLVAEVDKQVWVRDNKNETFIWEAKDLGWNKDTTTRHLIISNSGLIARMDSIGDFTIFNLEGDLLGSFETGLIFGDVAFTPSNDLLITSYKANGIEVWRVNE